MKKVSLNLKNVVFYYVSCLDSGFSGTYDSRRVSISLTQALSFSYDLANVGCYVQGFRLAFS